MPQRPAAVWRSLFRADQHTFYEAAALVLRGLDRASSQSGAQLAARVTGNMAATLHVQGHSEEAMKLYAQALQMARRGGELLDAAILWSIGVGEAVRVDFDAAVERFDESLDALLRSGGERQPAVARVILLKGEALFQLCRLRRWPPR